MKLFIKTKNKYIQLIQGTFIVQKETYNIKIIIDSKIVLPIVSKTKISVKTKRTKKKKKKEGKNQKFRESAFESSKDKVFGPSRKKKKRERTKSVGMSLFPHTKPSFLVSF
jgi:ribonuclease HI